MGNGNSNRQQETFNRKRQGWNSDDHRKSPPSGDEREALNSYRQQQRKPFDPALEKVVGEVGRIPLDRDGKAHIIVEFTSYDNGPKRMEVRKAGIDRDGVEFKTYKLGKLWPDMAKALAELLLKGVAVQEAERPQPKR